MEMLPKTTLLLVLGLLAVLQTQASTTVPLSQLNHAADNEEVIDIDETHDNLHDISSDGSGDSDNDEEEESSGNSNIDDVTGSGVVEQPEKGIVPVEHDLKLLTACKQHHMTSMKFDEKYIPQCTNTGEYRKLQCMDTVCWCAAPSGKIIKGSKRKDVKPDCKKGSNLLPCVWDLVRHHSGLLGAFRPNCSESGEYEQVQCHGSKCWCSDKDGEVIKGTGVQLPQMPVCDAVTAVEVITVKKLIINQKVTTVPTTTTTIENKHQSPDKPEIGPKISSTRASISSVTLSSVEMSSASSEDDKMYEPRPNESATEEPGIMAAIIAGAVVGLFVCILLTMFIVYRMRKKDEGSYPLDEPSKSNYSYTKAPDKEFYA